MKPSRSEEYTRQHPRSWHWYGRAKEVLPSGVSYAIRDVLPYPFYVQRAFGCHLEDVDGNLYTDYWSGHGALILGHSPAPVLEAVRRQLDDGTHFGYSHPKEVELAEMVRERMPCAEMIRFTNSGTEANMYAVGLARAATGRAAIMKTEGGWHGGFEPLHKAVRSPFTGADAAGLNPAALADTHVVPFNDSEATCEAIRRERPACFLVEPMLGAAGFIPAEQAYLRDVREACNETGTLLVFDEVITGFRLGPGGAQAYYGVVPDMAIIGKILGGGFPIGGICGRRDILSRFDNRRFPAVIDRPFHGGTFCANPVSLTAGIETLRALSDGQVYGHLERLGERVRSGLEGIFREKGFEASVTGLQSTFAVHFCRDRPRNAREAAASDRTMSRAYYEHMLAHGIAYVGPVVSHMFLNGAHTEEDIDQFLAQTVVFVDSVQTGRTLNAETAG